MARYLKTFEWPADRGTVMAICESRGGGLAGTEGPVRRILKYVSAKGDAAICRFTTKYDGVTLPQDKLELSAAQIARGAKKAPNDLVASLKLAARNIKRFHKQETLQSWEIEGEKGVRMGKRVMPIDRVGVYVPGGTAVYASSVLMNVIPAKLAGVEEIMVFTPPDEKGNVSPNVLAAVEIAGANRVFRVGGVQAIAAMTYGTETIPRVDKIAGPGNRYVTTAKRLVYGDVDIDMVAGPSEVAIIADKDANPEYIAAEMMAQAEHDEYAQSLLFTTSKRVANKVAELVDELIFESPRRAILRRSFMEKGAIVVAAGLDGCCDMANIYAAEHLQILTAKPRSVLKKIKHAGAIFLGEHTPVALGDYGAGPNHVLPTGRSARYCSPLGVKDFLKESSVLEYTQEAFESFAPHVERMAEAENLPAHAETIKIRLKK
jgi:histidinol dehydrogenase